ncbi:MAG: hypothetical protein ACD_62C00033G0007 [uncultured bacterium]|nr:MAG: hypothetical protein ACD_62C00033G0007 [uncultured bacterium]
MQLNPKQQEAVEHRDGPLLILAGAGSGKTRVLVERIVRLMQTGGVNPWNIMAVTFTNKAAKEMKERVAQSMGQRANDLWMATFHSFCLRLLRRHAEVLNYHTHFTIYDDLDQRSLIKKILKDMQLSDTVYKPASIQYHINKAKNDGIKAEDFPSGGDFFLKKVGAIFAEYQKHLILNQAMDFGDLIVNALHLFGKSPEILSKYQNQFQHILVDEYQDTNKSQYALIRLLADKWKNVCVVGDDDQSIYKFRGAEIRNILDFQRDYPQAKVIRLEQNYRSTQNILNASNAVIRGNTERMGKELWTQNGQGECIRMFGGQTDHDEAEFVCSSIMSHREKYRLGDMAIFYRTNAQSRILEDSLRKHKIPYRIFGGIKFYDRAEIKDMMSYLKTLVNPSNTISLKRILNTPARGIGKTTVERIDAAADRESACFWDVISSVSDPRWALELNTGTMTKIEDFVKLIARLNQARQEIPLDDFLTFLYEQTGYWQMLTAEKTIEAQSRQENLTEFTNVLDDYLHENEEGTLESFLDQISLASDTDKMDDNTDFVNLMTVHLAKGLEYPVVFLVGLEEGLFPHVRSFDKPEDIQEERRLCYVGMTRAKELLHISFVNERKLFGSTQYQIASRFLDEIPEKHVTMMHDFGYQARGAAPVHKGPSWSSTASYPQTRKQSIPKHETQIDYQYSQAEQPCRQGSRVRHAVFGEGKIILIEGGNSDQAKVTIEFGRGIRKKLSLKHANLVFVR